jgi:hypothetical protein
MQKGFVIDFTTAPRRGSYAPETLIWNSRGATHNAHRTPQAVACSEQARAWIRVVKHHYFFRFAECGAR